MVRKAGLRVLLAVFWIAACQAATLARYPYLQNVGSDHATIIWATQDIASGTVRYSSDQMTFATVSASMRAFWPSETGLAFAYYQYEAQLTALLPGTIYHYQVLADATDLTPGEDNHFRTAAPGPFTFLAFGDSGVNTSAQQTIAQLMMQEGNVSLVLHTGDIAYMDGSFAAFQSNHFDIYDSNTPSVNGNLMRQVPFFMSVGNHEYETTSPFPAFPYLSLHAPPTDGVPAADAGRYYSFDWGNAHFISLDSNNPLFDAIPPGTGGMLQWLDDDLRKTTKFWRIVYFHHPPYADGPNVNDTNSQLARQYVAPILERYDVPLVLNGHEHSYQRTVPIRNNTAAAPGAGTVYIDTGGGGIYLYPLSPPTPVGEFTAFGESSYHYVRGEVQPYQMTLHAIRIDGSEMDTLALAPAPRADAVVNAASFTPATAPGALISIFGRYLAAEENQASSLPLPTQFPGVGVTLNGRPLPLLYVSSTQINAQLPFDAKGSSTLRITTPNGSSPVTLTISDTAPAIFSVATGQGAIPAVAHANGTLVSPAAPAQAGEFVSVYLTGLGQVSGQISAGQAAPSSPPLTAGMPVGVQIDSGPAIPTSFAGLTPGFAGLYQVNFQMPQLATGTHSLTVFAGGSASNPVTLPVSSATP